MIQNYLVKININIYDTFCWYFVSFCLKLQYNVQSNGHQI